MAYVKPAIGAGHDVARPLGALEALSDDGYCNMKDLDRQGSLDRELHILKLWDGQVASDGE